MSETRSPAVAGTFYPSDPEVLRRDVLGSLEAAEVLGPGPEMVIAPHAGYDYSGPVAGVAFRQLVSVADTISRVVLLGPSHFHSFAGLATSGADAFATPLGPVPVDVEARRLVEDLPPVQRLEAAHRREHSLEVELPFLQCVLDEFALVPLVLGDVAPRDVAEVLDAYWDEEDTVVVVSSDLSHYLSYEEARELDAETASWIEQCRSDLDARRACGFQAINGALLAARERGLEVRTLDLCNSGDIAGPRDRVVGYGAFAAVGW